MTSPNHFPWKLQVSIAFFVAWCSITLPIWISFLSSCEGCAERMVPLLFPLCTPQCLCGVFKRALLNLHRDDESARQVTPTNCPIISLPPLVRTLSWTTSASTAWTALWRLPRLEPQNTWIGPCCF